MKAKFTRLERKVGAIAVRQARSQLMSVPWARFRAAYEKYVRWHSFALWVRAIVEAAGEVPSWLEVILKRRCPGFAKETDRSSRERTMAFRLLPWIHGRAFAIAKAEGWLDALVFYGFRDSRSQGSWAHWEYCMTEWGLRVPKRFPTFAEWWRSALNWNLCGDVTCVIVAKTVEKYIDFEALVYWLRPLLQAPNVHLPRHVARELRGGCPGLLEFLNANPFLSARDQSRGWRRLIEWGNDHVLARARQDGALECVLRQARFHPLHVRLAEYTAIHGKSQGEKPGLPYPSLQQWRRHAETTIVRGKRWSILRSAI